MYLTRFNINILAGLLIIYLEACLAESESVLKAAQSESVHQVHIALAGRDEVDGHSTSMTVSWNTANPTCSRVRFGLNSGEYTEERDGDQNQYWESWNHHVSLGELKPDTQYFYQAGCGENWSEEKSFTSAPLTSSLESEPWDFIAFGDLGVVNGKPTADYMDKIMHAKNNSDIKLVWHAGDVGYADDSFLHFPCYTRFCYERRYDEYMERIQDKWAASKPYMTTPGNHEADCHSPSCMLSQEKREKLSNFTAYNARFRMPSLESNGSHNMWYSFNYGNVHFVSIDTETGFPGAVAEKRYVMPCGGFGDMISWLEQDLMVASKPENRRLRPWILVAGHRPFYEESGDSIVTAEQAALERLMMKYGVAVFINGHRHFFFRTFPLYNGFLDENGYQNPKAPFHLTVGGPGNDEMDSIQRWRRQLEEHERDKEANVALPADLSPPDTSAEGERESRMLLSTAMLDKAADYVNNKGWKVDDALKHVHASMFGPRGGEADSTASRWVASEDLDNHVGIARVRVHGSSTLKFEYIRTKTGEVFDTWTLTKDNSIYPLKDL